MDLAVQTTASTFGIWAIVIVAVSVLAFWIAAIMLADRSQVLASGRNRPLGGATATDESWAVEDEPAQGNVPTRVDIPVQQSGEAAVPAQQGTPAQHAMPAQRTGEADRAERSGAARSGQDDAGR